MIGSRGRFGPKKSTAQSWFNWSSRTCFSKTILITTIEAWKMVNRAPATPDTESGRRFIGENCIEVCSVMSVFLLIVKQAKDTLDMVVVLLGMYERLIGSEL